MKLDPEDLHKIISIIGEQMELVMNDRLNEESKHLQQAIRSEAHKLLYEAAGLELRKLIKDEIHDHISVQVSVKKNDG